MNGKRAKQLRRASGLNPKILRRVQRMAFDDGHPEEIYMAVPTPNKRLWNGKCGRTDQFYNPISPRKPGKRNKYVPEAVYYVGPLGVHIPVPTEMFSVQHIPQLPSRLYRNVKRVFKREARAGRRLQAIALLERGPLVNG